MSNERSWRLLLFLPRFLIRFRFFIVLFYIFFGIVS